MSRSLRRSPKILKKYKVQSQGYKKTWKLSPSCKMQGAPSEAPTPDPHGVKEKRATETEWWLRHRGRNTIKRQVSEWVFYAVPTARVIFTAKTSLDVFSLSWEQVWTFSVLGDRIYEMRCPFVAVGLNARFTVLPHWDNKSQAHMLTHPVTLYWHRADQLCFVVPTSS